MQLNPRCICCQINKQESRIRQFDDEQKKLEYMQKICRRIAQATSKDCAPSLSREFKKFFSEFWQVPVKDFSQINREFNSLMMSLEPSLREQIQASPDPLEKALVYSRTGNYIDFSVIPDVNQDTAVSLLSQRENETLDPQEYRTFLKELKTAHSLVYLTDNCGEIVLDKLVVEVLKQQYPRLAVTVIVRGAPTANDATLEDARMCGLTKVAPVMGNGSDVGGTWLPGINAQTQTALSGADLILSKGQGNYETLHGCGMNIYYLFLCKCDHFVQLFHTKPLAGMFVNERRIAEQDLSFSSD